MQPGIQYQPTVPMPPPAAPPPRGNRTAWVALLLAITALIGAAIGIALAAAGGGAGTGDATAPAGLLGTLEVVSNPADGAVTVDGRLVGLSPIDRLDLDPGRHAVVIDVYGYQPYVGTIEIEAGGAAALEAYLAPLGSDGASKSNLRGRGHLVDRAVPRSALAPVAAAGAAESSEAAAPAAANKRKRAPRNAAPPTPRRDCSGERSDCREGCDDAHFSCWSGCDYCGSCTTDMTWDECNRICKTCRDGCERNKKFCESSCETSYDSCNR